jgi:2-polyprenyl-6-methoxyphenol hydroxylase-like FAD-dependent oxidoreductase
MRTGGPLYCLVNARTGREQDFAGAKAPQGKRIAVVGAGPAGLTYATLVGGQNDVVVFEREMQAGGALRQAALAPRFQEVEAESGSLARYIAGLEDACVRLGVRIQYGVDVSKHPEQLAGFDQVVVATGARYRVGIAGLVAALLETGVARWPGVRQVFEHPVVRNFLYHRARTATGASVASLAQPGQSVTVIGDAVQPGKSTEAIASAFDAALRGSHGPAQP